jgi:UDP-glucose 4-epimerase
MSGKNILVTGGAGFIGGHLVAQLASQGYNIKVIDNLSTGKLSNIDFSAGKIEFIDGDIRDFDLVNRCLQNVDGVFHLAAQTSVPFSIKNPAFNDDVNIKGTSNLLNASVENGIKRFVFVSSCAVYGNPTYLPIDEKHPVNPISPYAKSKLASEQECVKLHKQALLNSVVIRFFNVYGPRQGLSEYSGVITKFMEQIKNNQPLVLYGDGSQTRDFVYVTDAVNALILAYQSPDVSGDVFNIGTGVATSIKELAKMTLSLTDKKLGIDSQKERVGDIQQSFANISKAQKMLKYAPKFDLRRGLADTLHENGLCS